MGACVGKNSHLKHGKHEPYLPVLRKCHELTKVNLVPTADTDVLSVLAKHCHRLEEIEWRFDNLRPVRREVLSKLCDECADSLTKVRVKELCEQEFNSESGLSILIVYSEYLSNVTHVSVALDSDKCLKYFQLFADIYSDRIVELELRLKFSSEYCLVGETFAYVSLFRRLRAIHLTLESVSNGQTLDVELSAGAQLLATQCPLLTRVTIELRDHIRVTGDQPVLASLSSLTNLQALEVRIRTDGIELGTLDALKPMVKLHQLSFTYGSLTDWHTRDIADNCAQLTRLTLKTGQRLSDETLYSVSCLPRLKDFRLYCQPYVTQDIGDAGVCHMVANCHRLQHIALECGVKCSEVTFLALIGWANKRKHLSHRFSFSWERPDECNSSRDPNARLPAHELWPDLLRLPQNLTVVCREYFLGKRGTAMATAIERYHRLFKWSAPVVNGVVVGADQLDSRCINRESVRSVGHTNPQTPPVYYKFARYPDVVPQPL
ncbi:unnamed protein product [Medioppia subpectinata]|uniref:Uncharacterized protein n=1 Tax=Medioppia subpectinata TaxID=1979941 RepID=A0A7R9Q724_9ACAR|nr:unnamed protein product [Medioppia subpectinata]CAG2114354.1 unnamed protein product [Medioppia subpectinata]